ncbi:carbon-nitrogen hydrolase family protein [Kocuria sp.]|uniref:carbon-nitrogen hydrolase family protein n=1 Tax=Kocuria sp. TaxID=1871328 RepID=UPI0025C2379A|nr:carbon-nitrogen hydrolase family protein [Kocuria sp.]
MRIALGQCRSGEDVPANLRTIGGIVEETADLGAEMVVFPEYATYLKKTVDLTFPRVAEPLNGPVCDVLAGLAARHRMVVVTGMVETSDEPGRVHNTLVVHGPDGAQLTAYRKIHLFDAQGYTESRFVKAAPAPDPVVFDAGGMRFGLMTCYDLRFPELPRALTEAGAQVLVNCAAWVPGELKLRQWQVLSAARAIENGAYLLGACQAEPLSTGHSLVVDPFGSVLEELGPAPGILMTDICPEKVAAARERFPTVAQHRRPSQI